jgi:predicted MPP superfamily phosphohydrolase
MKKRKKLIIIVVIMALTVCFCWLQNNRLTVTYYPYENEKISKDWDGCRILQISDLHNKEFGKNNGRLLKKIEQLEPDIILLTGDIVDSNHTDIEAAISFAEQVVNISPTYYVTGNHENWLSEEEKRMLIDSLKSLGVTCLENEAATIEKNHSTISLVGLNDENLSDDTLKCLTDNIDKDNLTVVLAHEPQYFAHYCETDVDLVLSGHAHGGQIRLPFLGGLVAPDQGFLPEYTEGRHTNGATTMIISRGLGNSIIPLRLFNQPEIVCVDLQS